MRLLHTSDWHLGRLLHGTHLTSDQAHVLDQLVGVAVDRHVDAVLVAGDLYDRQVPPPEAVALLDDVFSRLVLEHKIPVLAIAGNHDSPERLGFGSRLFAAQGLHVAGARPARVELGPVDVFLIPYAEPSFLRAQDHDTAFASQVDGLRRPGVRSVLVAHLFVAGGEESESERPLSVGGAGTVQASRLEGFDYAALGHLHRPQERYSGSLLKYSFREAGHKKSVSIVEMDAAGRCRVERVALTPRHDLRRVAGTLEELLRAGEQDLRKEDYLEVTLTDRGALLDPMARLRQVYPNVLNVLRPDLVGACEVERVDPAHPPDDLFAAFFKQVVGQEASPAELEAYLRVLEGVRREEVPA